MPLATMKTSPIPNEWKRVETAIDRQTLIRIDERETTTTTTAATRHGNDTAGSWLTTNWTSVFRAAIIDSYTYTRPSKNGQQAKGKLSISI